MKTVLTVMESHEENKIKNLPNWLKLLMLKFTLGTVL